MIAGIIITMMFSALAIYFIWDAYKKNPELEKLKKPLIFVSVLMGLVILVNFGVILMNLV